MSEPDTDTGGAVVPPTVPVAEMGDDALLLQGWRVGPSAYVCAVNPGPLREALSATFGSDLVRVGRSGVMQARP